MFLVFALISFFMPALIRLVILRVLFGVFGRVCRICGQVRRPPIGGFALSKVMSGVTSTSTTLLAARRLTSNEIKDYLHDFQLKPRVHLYFHG